MKVILYFALKDALKPMNISEKIDAVVDEFNFYDYCCDRELFFDEADKGARKEQFRTALATCMNQMFDFARKTWHGAAGEYRAGTISIDQLRRIRVQCRTLRNAARYLKTEMDHCVSNPSGNADRFYEVMGNATNDCRDNHVNVHYSPWLRDKERGQSHIKQLIKRLFTEGRSEAVANLLACQLKRIAHPLVQPERDCYEVAKEEVVDCLTAKWLLAACTRKFKTRLGNIEAINAAIEHLSFVRERLIDEERDEQVVTRSLDQAKMEADRFTVELAYVKSNKLSADNEISAVLAKPRSEPGIQILGKADECYAEINVVEKRLELFLFQQGPGQRRKIDEVKLPESALWFLVGGMEDMRANNHSEDAQLTLRLKWSSTRAARFLMDKDFEDLDAKAKSNLRKRIQRISDLVTIIRDTDDPKPLKLLTDADANGDRTTTVRFRFSSTKQAD